VKIQVGFRKPEVGIDVPEGIIALQTREYGGMVHNCHKSGHLGELIAVVGLRGGSRVTGGLWARELASVAVRDWSDNFTFIVGDHRYRCRSSDAQFLSPRVSKLHSIDDTIDDIRIDVEDGDELFGSVLEAAQCGSVAVDSGHRLTFVAICAALWNSELYESVCGQLSDEVTMDDVVDRLRFLSATRCDISAEVEFIASHFHDFLCRRDALNTIPFSLLYKIIGRGVLRVQSEDRLYDFISKGAETNQEMFRLFEFIRFECCSTDVIDDFFDLLSKHCYEIDASMWATLRTRLLLHNITQKEFPPSVKEGRSFDVPDGIITHVTRECGGNVHERHLVDVTSGSLEKETKGPFYGAKNAADLETDSLFGSAFRDDSEDIPDTRNNWVCCGFKERRIVPTQHAIGTRGWTGKCHLTLWLIETAADGSIWREVAREESNHRLKRPSFTATFAVAGGAECRLIRLVNIGRNRRGDGNLFVSEWEIFGSLFE
jgi:hypothetical protein